MSFKANVHIHYNGKAYAPDKVITFKEGDEELRDQLLADEAISGAASSAEPKPPAEPKLPAEPKPPAEPKLPAEPKPLAEQTVRQLKATAKAEKIDLPADADAAPAIVALIEAARAAAAQTE